MCAIKCFIFDWSFDLLARVLKALHKDRKREKVTESESSNATCELQRSFISVWQTCHWPLISPAVVEKRSYNRVHGQEFTLALSEKFPLTAIALAYFRERIMKNRPLVISIKCRKGTRTISSGRSNSSLKLVSPSTSTTQQKKNSDLLGIFLWLLIFCDFTLNDVAEKQQLVPIQFFKASSQ